MVQTKTVGSTISCVRQRQADRAGLPVMWPHKSERKMRRDGSSAVLLQRRNPVDERGRLHVVPGLCRSQQRSTARVTPCFTGQHCVRRSRILTPANPQLRLRDKSAACIAAFVVIAPGLVHLREDGAASSLSRSSRRFIGLAASHHAEHALLYDECEARVRARHALPCTRGGAIFFLGWENFAPRAESTRRRPVRRRRGTMRGGVDYWVIGFCGCVEGEARSAWLLESRLCWSCRPNTPC